MPRPHSIEAVGEQPIAERRAGHRHRHGGPRAIAVADLAALVAAPAAKARIVAERTGVAEASTKRDDAGEIRNRARNMPRCRSSVAELARVVVAPATRRAVRERGARMRA